MTWRHSWARKGWRTKTGPVKNLELVQRAGTLHDAAGKPVIAWVRGHSGNPWNERADKMCGVAMREHRMAAKVPDAIVEADAENMRHLMSI